MTRYKITYTDDVVERNGRVVHSGPLRRDLSLTQARHIATKIARRFVAKHGGTITQDNWGVTGGDISDQYRRAVIELDRGGRS